MLGGFREFILHGNVVELAVAVVLAAAFGAVSRLKAGGSRAANDWHEKRPGHSCPASMPMRRSRGRRCYTSLYSPSIVSPSSSDDAAPSAPAPPSVPLPPSPGVPPAS